MEIIKEADFRKEIKTSPGSGYLFFGEEDYLKAHAVKTARELICPDETYSFFNDFRLDALNYSPAKLLDALSPLPMMTDRKIVTLCGLNFSDFKQSDLTALCEVLAEIEHYDYNVVILSVSADGLDPGYLPKKPSATLTELSKYLTPVQFERIQPAKLAAWVQKHFSHNGIEAPVPLCNFLIDYCGRSMYRLANEIDKVSFYESYHGKTAVAEADIRLVCTPSTEYDAFAFANAVTENRREEALNILADYKFRRMEPLLILGDLIRIFCDMAQVASLSAEGLSPQQISAVTKLHEFKVGIYQKALRMQNAPERVGKAIKICCEADMALKTAPQGYSALEKLICTL